MDIIDYLKKGGHIWLDAENRIVGFTNLGTTQGNRELNAALLAKKVLSPETIRGLSQPDFDFKTL